MTGKGLFFLGVVVRFLSQDSSLVGAFNLDVELISIRQKVCHMATITTRRITGVKRVNNFRAGSLFGADEDDSFSESNLNSRSMTESSSNEQQLEIDDDIEEDLPMFSFSFNQDNFDQTKVPVPMFTASVILLYSIVVTYYLFDVGINGFPDG
jgi:hypothetical protein